MVDQRKPAKPTVAIAQALRVLHRIHSMCRRMQTWAPSPVTMMPQMVISRYFLQEVRLKYAITLLIISPQANMRGP